MIVRFLYIPQVLNNERRAKFEARCAKMDEMAKEKARRKQEELDKASAEMERLKKVISDQFAEASQRNAEREEAASIQERVFMEIAGEEQQKLAKVRGEIAAEKAKEVYKTSAQGIRKVENHRRMKVRKEESRRAREDAALHRRSYKRRTAVEAQRKRKETNAAGIPVNECLHSDKHIMECQCCQPPESWGVTKSIPMAWSIAGMARKDRPFRVIPLQEQNLNQVNVDCTCTGLGTCMQKIEDESRHQQKSNRTRELMQKDKLKAKQQAVRKQKKKPGLKASKATNEEKPAATSSQHSGTSGRKTRISRRPTPKDNTRKMMRRDKLKAKQKLAGANMRATFVHSLNESAVRNDATKAKGPGGSEALQVEEDVLDAVVRELLALDDMYDPQLDRLMKERRELMASL